MSTSQTFYLNGASLGSSTAVFLDADLTECAPDGFYSDGTIVRQQVSCALLPQQSCPDCASACDTGILSFVGDQGVYRLSIDSGTAVGDVGAIIIRFNPFSVPVGLQAVLDGNVYNAFSSKLFGLLQGSAGLPTYLGWTPSDCGIVAGSPHLLNVFEFDGTSFISTGTTESVTILAGQLDLTAPSAPDECVMVIPKTVATPSVVDISAIIACENSAFNISIACPAALPSFSSSVVNAVDPCALPLDQTYYSAPVNGDGTTLGLYDWVFSDPNGEFVLSDGYYLAPLHVPNPYSWFLVASGVITLFGSCPASTLDYDVVNAVTPPCDANVAPATLELSQGGTVLVTSNAPGAGTVTIDSTLTTADFSVTWGSTEPCDVIIELKIEIDAVVVENQIFSPIAGGTYSITHDFSPIGVSNITATVSTYL